MESQNKQSISDIALKVMASCDEEEADNILWKFVIDILQSASEGGNAETHLVAISKLVAKTSWLHTFLPDGPKDAVETVELIHRLAIAHIGLEDTK